MPSCSSTSPTSSASRRRCCCRCRRTGCSATPAAIPPPTRSSRTGRQRSPSMSSGSRARVAREASSNGPACRCPTTTTSPPARRTASSAAPASGRCRPRRRRPRNTAASRSSTASISEVDQDLLWHKATGYVPITLAAYEKARAEGYYVQNPGADAAIIQLSRAEPTPNSMGFRLGGFVEIRNILQEELEKGFQGQQDAAAAARTANAARQRGAAELREGEQGLRQGGRALRTLPPAEWRLVHALRFRYAPFGTQGRLQAAPAALPAAAAADGDHHRLLLLAGGTGGVVRLPAPGRLRHPHHLRRGSRISRTSSPTRSTSTPSATPRCSPPA